MNISKGGSGRKLERDQKRKKREVPKNEHWLAERLDLIPAFCIHPFDFFSFLYFALLWFN